MWILVALKIDGKIARVFCSSMEQDPLFPTKSVLVGVQDLVWPFKEKFVHVGRWSVPKDSVHDYMIGEVKTGQYLSSPLAQMNFAPKKSVPEPIPEPIPESVPESVPEPIPEPIPESVPEPAPELIPDEEPNPPPPQPLLQPMSVFGTNR